MRTVLLLLAAAACPAAVTEVRFQERTSVAGGRSFGSSGAYERITGKVYFEVDPRLRANQLVRDLRLAPRNQRGRVEFSADFYILKPLDPAKANGTLLFEVPNRGGKGMVMHFDLAPGGRSPGVAAGDLGDAYLLEQGYTLVWLGWQWDAPQGPDALLADLPIARQPDGSAIRGQVRADFVPDTRLAEASLGDMNHQAYGAVDLNDPAAVLTVRDKVEDPRLPVARGQWRFRTPTTISLDGGFAPGRIYELIYTSQAPRVAGLGPAGIRDFISFLKNGGPETLLGDQRNYLKRAIGYGISQSGRFLRNFLYDGFNADEQGRPVFDAVWAHVAGAGRGNFNYRFAQASRDARPFLNFFYPVDLFPFTDLPERDGATEAGLLDLPARQKVVPKIFYTNTSYEYWGRAASLIHTTPDGAADAPLAPSTRIYFLTGFQHTPGKLPPSDANSRYPANPDDYRYLLRALLADLQAWVRDGVEPPESRYPRLSEHQLTAPAALRFPEWTGARVPSALHKAYRVDYGPRFRGEGLVQEPPRVATAFPVLVPQLDEYGNELGGLRLPEVVAPLGIYTGWNYRPASTGAPGEMASFLGSWFAFPRARVDQLYRSEDAYLARVREAAGALVGGRFLLKQDVEKLLARAREEWSLAHLTR